MLQGVLETLIYNYKVTGLFVFYQISKQNLSFIPNNAL